MNVFSEIPEISQYAVSVDVKFIVLTVLSILVVLLIFVLVVTFSIRYRRGSNVERGPLPAWISRDVEISWTMATLFTFLFIFWWAASSELSALNPPKSDLEIHIEAKQWMWKVQQPSGPREINTIHVPADTSVRLVMTSNDVIHSLFLPALRIKQDVLPGRYTYLSFKANKTGVFNLMCAEFCGTAHSRMLGRFIVFSPADYARWTAAQPEADDLAREGEALFISLGCSGCHAPTSRVHAPDLHRLFGHDVQLEGGRVTTADEAYVRDSILLPKKDIVAGFSPIMPSFRGIVAEDEMVRLIAYIKSLSTEQGALP